MSHRRSGKRVLTAVIGVLSIAALASWQFYEFVTFKNSEGLVDVQGGSLHLWLAIVLALLACVGAFLCFSIFLSYDRNGELHITSQPSLNPS